tara:strand:- start:2878 stop:3051 length:174 start_codon:yes stop_codon:yes gene_type:complete
VVPASPKLFADGANGSFYFGISFCGDGFSAYQASSSNDFIDWDVCGIRNCLIRPGTE